MGIKERIFNFLYNDNIKKQIFLKKDTKTLILLYMSLLLS